MITLKQMIEILEPGEWLEIYPQGGDILGVCGSHELPKEVEPYLGWKCEGLGCSNDAASIGVVPPDERKDDGKKE